MNVENIDVENSNDDQLTVYGKCTCKRLVLYIL